MLTPKNDYLIIIPDDSRKESRGITLPDSAKMGCVFGIVERGNGGDLSGKKIVYKESDAYLIMYNDKEYKALKKSDMIAVVTAEVL